MQRYTVALPDALAQQLTDLSAQAVAQDAAVVDLALDDPLLALSGILDDPVIVGWADRHTCAQTTKPIELG